MKKALFFAVLSLCACLYARAAEAAYVTGSELAASCGGSEAQQIFSCTGYIAGVIDYHVMMQSLGTNPSTDFCLPQDLSVEEASFVVMNYLKRSPQHGAFIAAPAVAAALHEVFPCAPALTKKKKK